MQLKFNNNTMVDVLTINGGSRYFQGANRDSLEIQLDKGKYSFDELDKLTGNPANTAKFTILDGEEQFVHENYVLRVELAIRAVEVSPANSAAAAVIEEHVCIILAQKTYMETQLDALRSAVDTLTAGKER